MTKGRILMMNGYLLRLYTIMRGVLKDQLVGLDPKFRYRGLNQTRIETFSDAVFAFSFTLVVLSSSVPETFAELQASLRSIIPFFICIVLIIVIWYQHYLFFLRYGMQDTKTVVINTLLLFLLLIYVYPLKFLTTWLVEMGIYFLLGSDYIDVDFIEQFNRGNMWVLLSLYGLGAASIFSTLAWLYRHAYKKREELDLNEYEAFQTKASLQSNLLMSTLPFLSAVIAIIRPFGDDFINFSIAGFIYMLYTPMMFAFSRIVNKKGVEKFDS